ncbi:hypothetical protein cyc_04144 [Cyclospora cayetanensis]|uniref:Uncharacterized protein n=1 Tax=Cyclospora cayetanensis TaxID=88456 RepID=A0A1D3CWS5_9EIME|nr:hypothetical protein cyc_04144 [Cyclospora cayetanensis]
MSLSQTIEQQQQTLQLLLLHPRLAPPSLEAPCCCVLKHQCEQLNEAVLLQQRLQQEARARWLMEAADQIRTCYPEASPPQMAQLLQQQGADSLWTAQITDGLVGSQLREKRIKLLRLEERLRELQQLTSLLQQEQHKRQDQQQQLAAVTTHSQKLTAAACTDLLLAHKYRGEALKQSLLLAAAVLLIFLFFVLPHTSLGSILSQAT